MKRIITCLLILSAMFISPVVTFAFDFSGNAETELRDISDKIITAVNEVYDDKGVATVNDIDYSKAYKVYVDTNIFELPTNEVDDIRNTLENGNYIYLVPVSMDNGTVVVNVQKGLPLSNNAKAVLTEKEQQEVLNNVGKWIVSSLTFYENGNGNLSYDYETILSNMIGGIPEDTILVGSLPIFQDVVALIPNKDGIVESIVPVAATTIDGELVNYMRKDSKFFDYAKTKDIANNLPEADPDMAGGAGISDLEPNHHLILPSGMMILIALGIGVSLYFRKKKLSRL